MRFNRCFAAVTAVAMLTASCAGLPGMKKINSVKLSNHESQELRENSEAERLRQEWKMLRDPRTGEIPSHIRRSELEFAGRLLGEQKRRIASNAANGIVSNASNLPWVSRGPNNISGRTRAMAVDISDATGNTIVAAGVSGSIYRTTNGGTSWTKRLTSAQLPAVTCIAQDRRAGKQNIWYAGTGEAKGNSADGGGGARFLGDGIYKSTDGALTWTFLASTSSNTPQTVDTFDYAWNIVTDSSNANQDVVYAALPSGLQRTTDGGTTWTKVLGDGTTATLSDVTVTSTGTVFASFSSDAAANKGVWKSSTGAPGSFTDITPPGFPATWGRIIIAVAPSDENILYILAETKNAGTSNHSLYKYDVAANTWTDRSLSLPNDTGATQKFDSQGSYDLVMKVKPNDPNTVFIGGTSLYRSTDGFATNTNTTQIGGYRAVIGSTADYLNHHPDQQGVFFLPGSPNVMFSNTDGGVFKTTDNTAPVVVWTALNNGMPTTQFYHVAVDLTTAGDQVITGGLQDRGNFHTSTSNWIELSGGDGAFAAVANNKTFYLYEVQNGSLTRLDPSGVGTPNAGTQIDPTAAVGKQFTNPLALDPNDSNILYYVGGRYLWRNLNVPTADQSLGWVRLTSTDVGLGGDITALAVSKSTANRIYYGSDTGKIYRVDGANGATPTVTDIFTGKGLPTNFSVSGLGIDPNNGASVLAAFSNYGIISVYYTNDSGNTWTAVAGNLEQNPDGSGTGPSVRTATILPVAGTTYYMVGTSTGVYSTTTLNGNNTTWTQEAPSLIGNAVVTTLINRPIDGTIFAATHGAGVYSVVAAAQAAPTVTSITPATGPLAGGTAVTITGTGFQAGATVRFGANAATGVTVVSATSITATSPAGAAGAVGVTVTNPDAQTATLAGAFTYAAAAAPTVTSIAPSSGALAGGTSVTITGTGFQTGATVKFGTASATAVVVASATSITATSPAGAAGAVNVVVTNPDAQVGTLTGGFTYTNVVKGDANGDGAVTVADVFYLINNLFAGGPAPVSGDANGDGAVTVADVFYEINFLFAGGPAPRAVAPTTTSQSVVTGAVFTIGNAVRNTNGWVLPVYANGGSVRGMAISVEHDADSVVAIRPAGITSSTSRIFEAAPSTAVSSSYITSFDRSMRIDAGVVVAEVVVAGENAPRGIRIDGTRSAIDTGRGSDAPRGELRNR